MDTYSLKQFITEGRRSRVVIPVIQRDFAQGRLDSVATQVRGRFLRSLREALEPGSPPLVLDFIYGTQRARTEGQETEFTPLDGQQRLTTLWLLHWYLAQRESRMADFQAFAQVQENADRRATSRFAYEVRPSSKEFFDALATEADSFAVPAANQSLAAAIRDQPWFLHAWQADPTVKACLTMLDDIHRIFFDCSGGFDRLAVDKAVVFHLLDLDRYGLSDDLYIRMNARGRPLTAFEVFKAELERYLHAEGVGTYQLDGRTVSAKDYVAHRWDKEWGDFFWQYRGLAGELTTYDAEIMNLVRATGIVWLPVYGTQPSRVQANMDWLRGGKDDLDLSFADLQEHDCAHGAYFQQFFGLLDSLASWPRERWSRDSRYESLLCAAMEGARRVGDRGLDWSGIVRFAVFCEGVRRQFADGDLAQWVAYFDRLAAATRFDKADEVEPSLRSIRAFPDVAPGQLHTVVAGQTGKMERFHLQQVEEERLKSQLRLSDSEWGWRIDRAEQHPWFDGQVEFLLDFAGVLTAWEATAKSCTWSAEGHKDFQRKFDYYLARSERMFDEKGPRKLSDAGRRDFLWERALLVFDEFLFHYEAENFCLPLDGDFARNWKRLLRAIETPKVTQERARARRGAVRQLLERLDDDDIEGTLRSLIAKAAQDGSSSLTGQAGSMEWRYVLIEDPRHLQYCGKRQLYFEKGGTGNTGDWTTVFLMEKIRRHALHHDLFLHRLFLRLRSERDVVVHCDPVSWEQAPHQLRVRIRPEVAEIHVFSRSGKYLIPVAHDTVAPDSVAVENFSAGQVWVVSFADVLPVLEHIADANVVTASVLPVGDKVPRGVPMDSMQDQASHQGDVDEDTLG